MSLRSRAFEKTILRRLREAIKKSPALKREAAHSKRQRLRNNTVHARIARVLVLTPLLMAVLMNAWEISPSVAMGLMAAWGTLMILIRLTDLMAQLYWPRSLMVELMLPLADEDLFRIQWRAAWLDSLFVLVDFAAAYLICAFRANADGLQLLAAVWFAVIQWLLTFATAALLLAKFLPSHVFIRIRDGLASCLVFLVVSTCVLMNLNKGLDTLLPALKWLAAALDWVTPSGWVNTAFHLESNKGRWIFMLPLIPVALTIGSLKASRRRLLANFRAHAPFLAEHLTRSMATRPTPETVMPAWKPGIISVSGPTAIADDIEAGKLATTPAWSDAGILEGWVKRWLTPRQLIVLSIGRRGAPGWSKQWYWAARFLAAGTASALLAGGISADLFFWVFYVTCVPVAVLVLLFPDFGWPGFGIHRIVTSRVPVYSMLPIGNREITALMTKISCVRFVASIPLLAIAGAIAGWKHAIGVAVGVRYALEIGLLFMAFFPFLFTVFIANGLRHVRGFRCGLLFLGIVLAGLVLLVISVIGLATNERVRVVVLLATAAVSWMVHSLYTWAYNRGWFDPDHSPQR